MKKVIYKITAASMSLIMTASVLGGCSKKTNETELKVRHKDLTETSEEKLTPPETLASEETDDTGGEPSQTTVEPEVYKETIKIYTSIDDTRYLTEIFLDTHPDFDYDFNLVQIPSSTGSYQDALESALKNPGDDVPDIFVADASMMWDYTAGDLSQYTAAYSDFDIDIEYDIEEAQITPYIYEIGTRQSDGKVIGLCYTDNGCVTIYRTDIAEEVFGTSDPAEISEIIGGNSGSLDKLMAASKKLSDAGYALCSNPEDLWYMINSQTSTPWVVDDKLSVSPERENFWKIAKELYDNGLTNMTGPWSTDWYDDMAGTGEKEVFAFFGPQWLVDFTILSWSADTTGNWNVTDCPINCYWGGTWMIPSIYASGADNDKVEAIGEFLYWLCLDYSTGGCMYKYAAGEITDGVQFAVPSAEVMGYVEGSSLLLGDQDPFPYYITASQNANAYMTTGYDMNFSSSFQTCMRDYVFGYSSWDEAMSDFESYVQGWY